MLSGFICNGENETERNYAPHFRTIAPTLRLRLYIFLMQFISSNFSIYHEKRLEPKKTIMKQ